jgi:Carboxypeptidase regulatory-like domain
MWLTVLMFCFLGSPPPSPAQYVFADSAASRAVADTRATLAVLPQQSWAPQDAGTVRGTVVDGTGAPVVGARVKLVREGSAMTQEVMSDEEGQFRFADVPPGPFQVTTAAEGFKATQFAGTLEAGQDYLVPAMALVVAGGSTEVQVTMTRTEIAEAEIRDEEKQRVLGVVPNFYVTYNPAAVPLTTKQKFELAWKATIDPVNFGLNAATAGIEQASDAFSGYGQGAQGYAKRYGASYADLVTGTFIGSAVLPSLLKQDPRYFYKGTGTKRSRVLYAIANAVICKGDNGRWQPNYSAILGGIAAGGISNLYYPSTDRGAGLIFENALIGMGTTAAANILQEFVIRKLTPHPPTYAPVTVTP